MLETEDKNNRSMLPDNNVFALDIGTRSIIGIVGVVENEKLRVTAIERVDHSRRVMIDGQIEDIDQVAKTAGLVKSLLEDKLNCTLNRVCVAAAGRALKTQKAFYEIDLPQMQLIDQEQVSRLEAGAIGAAESEFNGEDNTEYRRNFYLVGYSVTQYLLDNYPISNLKDHHGQRLRADVIATFLPREVVESLYTAMHKINLEVASLTLEPIAAINAVIPQSLRLLNLALVDVGAGTSDIAISRDGSVVGYTMATIAGDEITEALMKKYLVDFDTAETMKFQIADKDSVVFTDILGMEHTVTKEDISEGVEEAAQTLCKEIADKIIEVNGGVPSAVFLAGGGSKLSGMREFVAKYLKMDIARVAIGGNNYKINAFSEEYDINNPEYATPLGIAVSAGLNLINDSFHVILNGNRAKLFRSGSLSVLDVLMMNGFAYKDLMERTGQNLVVELNGKRTVIYGGHGTPAFLSINGIEAKVSDIIHAGDNIEFKPAKHGTAATACLSDLVSADYEDRVEVNGIRSSLDTLLKNGDTIFTDSPEKIKEADIPVESIEELPVYLEEAAITSVDEFVSDKKNTRVPEDMRMKWQIPIEEELAALQKKVYGFKPIVKLTLNDKPMELTAKLDGAPYYLMDMLKYTDIDFKKPRGNVILKVNGENGFFRQELKDFDIVQIYCEVH